MVTACARNFKNLHSSSVSRRGIVKKSHKVLLPNPPATRTADQNPARSYRIHRKTIHREITPLGRGNSVGAARLFRRIEDHDVKSAPLASGVFEPFKNI